MFGLEALPFAKNSGNWPKTPKNYKKITKLQKKITKITERLQKLEQMNSILNNLLFYNVAENKEENTTKIVSNLKK